MSIAKFVEGYHKVIDDLIAKGEAVVKENPYPLEELKKIKETLPESAIAKRYGEDGVIDKSTELIAMSSEQDKDLVKRLDAGKKARNQLKNANKYKDSDPEAEVNKLYSKIFMLIATARAAGSTFTMEELVNLKPDEFNHFTWSDLADIDVAYDMTLPISIDSSLILGALKEIYTKDNSKASETSPINESDKPKETSPSSSPLAEGEGEKPEAETSTTTSTATTSTPELPKETAKPAEEKLAPVNVTVETPPAPAPLAPAPPTPAPINAAPESTVNSSQTTNVTSTQQNVINEGAAPGAQKTSSESNETVKPALQKKMSMSELLSLSESSEKSSTATDNYTKLFSEVSQEPQKQAASSAVNAEAGKTKESTDGSTSETTSNSPALNESENASPQEEETSDLENSIFSLYSNKSASSSNTNIESKYLETEISKKAPMLSKTEAPLSKQQEASSPKSTEQPQVQQSQTSESPAPAAGNAESPAPAESAAPAGGEAPKAGGGGGMDTSEMENRLARIERVLSGPLDVRVIS